MRSHSSSDLKGACQTQTSTWPHVVQVKRMCSVTGPQHCSVLRSSSTGESRPVLYSVVWGVKICICVDFGFKATCGWNVIHHDFLRNQLCSTCEVGKASRPGPK